MKFWSSSNWGRGIWGMGGACDLWDRVDTGLVQRRGGATARRHHSLEDGWDLRTECL